MSDQTVPNVEDLVAAARADLAARKERGEATPARPPRLSADEKATAKASKAAERAKKKEEAAALRAQKKTEREAARAEKKAAREAERAAKAKASSDPVAVKASQELSVDQLKTALRLAKAALKAAEKAAAPAALERNRELKISHTGPWIVKSRAFSYFWIMDNCVKDKSGMRNFYAGRPDTVGVESDALVSDTGPQPAKCLVTIRHLLELYHMGRSHQTQSGGSQEGDDALEEIVTAIESACNTASADEAAYDTRNDDYKRYAVRPTPAAVTLKLETGSDEEELTLSRVPSYYRGMESKTKETLTLQINALRENISAARSKGESAPVLEQQLLELLSELSRLNSSKGVLLG